MPSPQNGTPCNLVPPAKPDEAHDADGANPGEVEKTKAAEREAQTGKYGSQPVEPWSPDNSDQSEKKKSWIAVKMIDKNGKPVPGERYVITLGDGRTITGTTGADGTARYNGLDPGSATISWPDLDNPAVKPK